MLPLGVQTTKNFVLFDVYTNLMWTIACVGLMALLAINCGISIGIRFFLKLQGNICDTCRLFGIQIALLRCLYKK